MYMERTSEEFSCCDSQHLLINAQETTKKFFKKRDLLRHKVCRSFAHTPSNALRVFELIYVF